MHYVGAAVGALMVIAIVCKVFIDRHMTLAEGVPIAILFGIWAYLQWHGPVGGSPLLLLIGYVLLGRSYRRNAPFYRQRFHERLAEIRARRTRQTPR